MKSISKVGFFVAAVLAAGAASAQTGGGLEEVIITAQKRAATLQDVPVAVTAVSGETIENNQIRDAKDLQQLVPSLSVSTAASSTNTTSYLNGVPATSRSTTRRIGSSTNAVLS
jgi:outer membrane cobalamin receptor